MRRAPISARVLWSVAVCLVVWPGAIALAQPAGNAEVEYGGRLILIPANLEQPSVDLPLTSIEIETTVRGPMARTTVRQVFTNPLNTPIEAQYRFPLPLDAAVDEMVMAVGDRFIVAEIRERAEARAVYERARSEGRVAGLLEQERANLFTQRVANIPPGEPIVIEISLLEMLAWNEGVYTWRMPLGVGASAREYSDDATLYPEPGTEPTPSAAPSLTIAVHLDAGAPLGRITSPAYPVLIRRNAGSTANIALANPNAAPDRPFVLNWAVETNEISDALWLHGDERGQFFSLFLQPPARGDEPRPAMSREVIFVIDRSGSMHGKPLAMAVAAMHAAIESMGPGDTFNLMCYDTTANKLFDAPQANTPEARERAAQFLLNLEGSGGTDMLTPLREIYERPAEPGQVRMVCFMSDGFVGNDYEIIDLVKRNAAHTRVFTFAVGNTANHFLLDWMAREGRGEAQYIDAHDDPIEAGVLFSEMIQAPILTDIEVQGMGLEIASTHPAGMTDLYSRRPLLIHGRLTEPGTGALRITGQHDGQDWERLIAVSTPEPMPRFEAIAELWAKAEIDKRTRELQAIPLQDAAWHAAKREIVDTSIAYHVLSDYTAMVAVEKVRATPDGPLVDTEESQLLAARLPATATSDPIRLLLAGLLAFLALAAKWVRRGMRTGMAGHAQTG